MAMLRHLFVAFFATVALFLETSASFGQEQAPVRVDTKRSVSPTLVGAPPAPPTLTYDEVRREANDIAVSIVVSGLTCTCARFAEVNDFPSLGKALVTSSFLSCIFSRM